MENLPEYSEKIKEKVCISLSQNGKYKGFYNKDFSTFTNNKENKESDNYNFVRESDNLVCKCKCVLNKAEQRGFYRQ